VWGGDVSSAKRSEMRKNTEGAHVSVTARAGRTLRGDYTRKQTEKNFQSVENGSTGRTCGTGKK